MLDKSLNLETLNGDDNNLSVHQDKETPNVETPNEETPNEETPNEGTPNVETPNAETLDRKIVVDNTSNDLERVLIVVTKDGADRKTVDCDLASEDLASDDSAPKYDQKTDD